ncbi:hypothetical protein H0H87_005432 [Tephrocybe sp. NHM501043]|nr:hypothetical protein H0H87_005432 [Tephrocybe sp. NHM501043]
MFSKVFLGLAFAFSAKGVLAASPTFNAVGDIIITQSPTDASWDSRIFFQQSDNAIVEFEIHVFYVSKSLLLSEYYWSAAIGGIWKGGSSCDSTCVDSLGAIVSNTNLTALSTAIRWDATGNGNSLQVTYVDSSNVLTLTAAIRTNGVWSGTAALPGTTGSTFTSATSANATATA